MQSRGLNALFPRGFLYGAGAVLALWLAGVFFERSSNFLVEMSLLVSSRKPHFLTLPYVGTGMTVRTIMALVGVMFVVGGVGALLEYFTDHGEGVNDPPPRPAKESIPDSPMPPMPPMGMPPMPPLGMPPMDMPPMGMPPMGMQLPPVGLPPLG